MSKSTATRPRPLSPHLTVWKPTVTYVTSIVHRITGGAMYFGTLLIAWWLIAASISEEAFGYADWFFGSWIGRLILFGYTWALMQHMLGGIRHFIWDAGAGLEKHTASKIAWINVVAAIVLTIVVWVAGYMARGA
jgi:succinate dehydrogenase / fumarate reductase cytochrome b subunit